MEETTYQDTTIRLVKGDITEQEVAAVVNAANSSLLGGGGVDGAIHRSGGPKILEECKEIRAEQGGCPTGEAVITTGGDLPAEKVIHAVGPVWKGGTSGEYTLLEKAYRSSLDLARKNELSTVAFPSISTGAYSFPIERAALVAFRTIFQYLAEEDGGGFDEIRMVLFSQEDFDVYADALDEVSRTMTE